jgi:SAM-dependent methyltransferase
MNAPFDHYGRYYDLLYRDKDYAAESEYIGQLIARFAPGSQHLLELGCGTGKHARELAQAGFCVTGVERSQSMIQAATAAANASDSDVSIIAGDARSVRLERTFDVVLSLFHVVSYQASNADVLDFFRTAAIHLKQDGCFLFDIWYGPAVLSQLPEQRVKEMEDTQTVVRRIANPVIDLRRNLVDVNYSITVIDKQTGQTDQLHESHRMRYFFEPEIELFAEAVGMRSVHCEPWLGGGLPTPQSWGVTCVLRKGKVST